MPTDRAATLKSAEKLLRQGKVNAAIEEYLRVVEESPRDWNTANVLGDLYVRVKQVDEGIAQFVRIADGLRDDGLAQKASAVYKKILKLVPDHEHALLQSAGIAAADGLLPDARAYLNAVADRRGARGDQRGVVDIKVRIAALDPDDVPARMAGARARLELQDVDGALQDLKQLAAHLLERERQPEAIEVLEEASSLAPADRDVLDRLFAAHLGRSDYARARDRASTPAQFKELASRLDAAGNAALALDVLADAFRLDPADTALQSYLARAHVSRGSVAAAAEYLTDDIAGDDPQLLIALAETRARSDRAVDALAVAQRILAMGPSHRATVSALGVALASDLPETAYRMAGLVADAAVSTSDWTDALSSLRSFVAAQPGHVPALLRLVEIGVDAGLDADTHAAQGQLADAYLAAGLADEARFIAEDLVAREPGESAHIERFRRALVLSGEADPDAVISARLSGDSPFSSIDLGGGSEERAQPDPPSSSAAPAVAQVSPAPPAAEALPAAPSSPAPAGGPAAGDGEVDLIPDLEEFFAKLRADAAVEASHEKAAEAEYERGLRLFDAGSIDLAMACFESAARVARFRFLAGSRLARIHREGGRASLAIEWFERAAEAPAPTADEGRSLLYDLADTLESTGELSRALAVCMELQAEAGPYRDLATRLGRLAKVQAGG